MQPLKKTSNHIFITNRQNIKKHLKIALLGNCYLLGEKIKNILFKTIKYLKQHLNFILNKKTGEKK